MDGESACRTADFAVIAAPANYDSMKNYFDCFAAKAAIKLVLRVYSRAIMVIEPTILME